MTITDALGRHLPDRALAKQARTAAIKHRSWMANGGANGLPLYTCNPEDFQGIPMLDVRPVPDPDT